MGASFPREARVLDAAGYDQIFKRNKRVASRYWTVLGHRRASMRDSGGRLGMAIAKKRAKRAVDRNRLKRIVRESFRHQQEQLRGLDVVVMNKDAAVNASRLELRESLDSLWIELVAAQRQ